MNYQRVCLAIAFLSITTLIACSKSSNKTELTVSSTSENFTAAGGSKDVMVTASGQWSVSDTSWWCLTSMDTPDGKFVILVQPNQFASPRTTTIIVSAGNLTRQVLVTQAGKTAGPSDTGVPDSIPPDQTGIRNITSFDLVKEMKLGWNVGNSLEATGSETAWGNPMISQQLIDSVKKAGFNAIRIPVAWSRFTDADNFKIDTNWMRRVEEVVNYVLKDDMYAIINMHWDGGWMQPTAAKQAYVTNRMTIMWKQIAKRFRNYGDHLLFAGSNEVMVDGDYGTPTAEYYTVQNGFNQTFVSTVRSTGGRNAYRHLLVQGFNTNIDHTINFFKMPTDPADKRLTVEVHYYDPYDFTINSNSNITQWGKDATDPTKTETWANEAYTDGQFQKMKTKFIDNGIPVVLGEYGAMARLSLGSPALNADHALYRKYYMEYVTRSMVNHGVIPFYWDSGSTGDKGMGIFDRSNGTGVYPDIIKAIIVH